MSWVARAHLAHEFGHADLMHELGRAAPGRAQAATCLAGSTLVVAAGDQDAATAAVVELAGQRLGVLPRDPET